MPPGVWGGRREPGHPQRARGSRAPVAGLRPRRAGLGRVEAAQQLGTLYRVDQRYEEAMTLVVTTRGAPAGVIEPVQRGLANLPHPPRTFFARTLEQQLDFALAPARVAATVAGLLATLALFLSSLGLYGLLSYTVAQRRRELGLRMALGAGRASVARLVVLDGLALVLSGLVVGALLAWPARAALSGLLFGVRPHDPLSLFGGALVLLAAAVLATWLPARRALALSPAEALREQ